MDSRDEEEDNSSDSQDPLSFVRSTEDEVRVSHVWVICSCSSSSSSSSTSSSSSSGSSRGSSGSSSSNLVT